MTRVEDFLQTLTEQEKLELIEEVRKMIESRNSNNTKEKKEKSSVEFTYMDDY